MDFIIFVINFIFSALYIMIAVRAVLPWMPHSQVNPILRPIYLLTDPLLSVVRIGLPPGRIGMDVSPFVAIILLWLVHQVILKILP